MKTRHSSGFEAKLLLLWTPADCLGKQNDDSAELADTWTGTDHCHRVCNDDVPGLWESLFRQQTVSTSSAS